MAPRAGMAVLQPLRRAGMAILKGCNPARRSQTPDLSSVLPFLDPTASSSSEGGRRRARGRSSSAARVQPRGHGAAKDPPHEWSLTLHAWEGDVLGAALGKTAAGAVILNIREGGLLDDWNRANPLQQLHPGLTITAVNGARGYWAILEELKRPGVLALKVSDQPPPRAGPDWFGHIAAMGRNVDKVVSGDTGDKSTNSSFIIRLQQEDPSADGIFSSLPNVVAGDESVDQCAICLDDVGPDETLVQLPCKHAFHPACAARWLTQGGAHAKGKRQCCPLCCRKVLCSPGGHVVPAGGEEEPRGSARPAQTSAGSADGGRSRARSAQTVSTVSTVSADKHGAAVREGRGPRAGEGSPGADAVSCSHPLPGVVARAFTALGEEPQC